MPAALYIMERDNMPTTNPIDFAVPVNFTIPQNGRVSLSTNDFTSLLLHSKEYTVGSGKNQCTYAIVHTDAGYIALFVNKSGAQAEWVADHFTITAVYSDEKGNHSFSFEHNGKMSVLPFQSIIPKNIDTEFYTKGVAINTQNKMHEAFSQYLQGLLSKFEVHDAKQILGWKMKKGQLKWMGANHEPPLLQYHNSCGSETAYMEQLNGLISGCHALQFVISGTAASTVLAYLRLKEKLPVDTFGISLKNTTSKGKTTALMLGASMYSSPTDEAVFSDFYGTQNALIYELGKHHGVPLCYDETTIGNGISKSDFVYVVSKGSSKKCLDTQRKPKERDTWLCTTLFSSETDLIDYEKDNMGLLVRIINLENMTYTKSSRHADELKTFAATNYGIIGKLLSEWLLKADSAKIKEMYDNARSELGNTETLCKCELTDRMIANHALILITAEILNNIGLQLDIAGIKDISITAMNTTAKYADRGKYLIQKIFGFISSNYHRLKGIEWNSNSELEPIKVSIEVGTFEYILNCIKWSNAQDALKHIAKTGCLIRQSEGRYKTRTTRDKVPYYSYYFDMNKVNEQFDGNFELNFSSIKQRREWDIRTEGYINVSDDSEAIVNGYNCKINGEGRTFEGKIFFL